MSLKYRDKNGAEAVICGLTPGGDLAFGASTTRSGTISCEASSTQSYCQKNIAFTEPMPDGDYIIEIQPASGDWEVEQWTCVNKTASGFTFVVHNINHTAPFVATNFYYNAFKLYEVSEAEQNASDITDIKAKIPSTASSSNKLATSNELSSLGTTIDGRLDALEDTIPSSASLQNQLITETGLTTALQGKQDTLTFDTTPTEDSSNPVTSDGVYDALTTKAAQTEVNDIVNIYGAKNVLPVSLVTQTAFNGVTITNYNNGTYLLNGTCTADASFSLHSVTESDFLAKVGKASYVLSGYPSISGNTGKVIFQYRKADDSGWAEAYTDNGQGVTLPYDGTKIKYTIYLLIKSGDSFSNVTFKPMIRLASIKDATYEPYTLTNQQMTPYVQSVSNPNILDNGWFTVNQRAFTSATDTTTLRPADRWYGSVDDSNITIANTANGITISGVPSNAGENLIRHAFEWNRISDKVGKTFTLSIMFADGSIRSNSGKLILPNTDSWQAHITVNIPEHGIFVQFLTYKASPSYGEVYIKPLNATSNLSVTIRAIKLEKGAVSTLANDTAPNYQQELAKCQRYFQRISQAGSSDTLCMATYRNDYTLRTVLPLTVPMRVAPSVTVSGTVSDYTNSGLTMAKISQPVTNGGAVGISFNISKSGITWNNGVSKCITPDSTDFYIDFSADL